MSEGSSDEVQDHTIRNDNTHDKEVQEAIEEMERLMNPTEISPSENKDFTIGRIPQQNTDLKTLVQKLKIKIDELVLRKDKSCFMCREELRSVKTACNHDLEVAKNEYSDKLEDLGDLLTQKNASNKKGKHFIICERLEYEDLHDRLRVTSDDCNKLRKDLDDQKFVDSVVRQDKVGKVGKVRKVDKQVEKIKPELSNMEKVRQLDKMDGKIEGKKVQKLKQKNFRLKEELEAINSHVGNMEELITVMKEQRRHYIGLLQQANKI